MHEPHTRRRRSWSRKFRDAFRGVALGVRGQSSFWFHFSAAGAVVAAAALMRMPPAEWALLLLCVAVVLSAEMFNSALESLARAITDEHDPHVRDALDIGSAAVLVASIGAAVVGAVLLIYRLGCLTRWW